MIREYQIAALVKDEERGSDEFLMMVAREKPFLQQQVLQLDLPPPRRELVFELVILTENEAMSRSLRSISSLAFDSAFLEDSGNGYIQFGFFLDGMFERITMHNENIKYYGVKLLICGKGLSDRTSLLLFSHFRKWCDNFRKRTDVDAYFELITTDDEFRSVLLNERFRIAYGDIQAQMSGLR